VSLASDATVADSVDIPEKLPRTFRDALQLLKASSPDLAQLLHLDILNHYVAVKQVESMRMAQLDQGQVDRLMVTFF